MSESFASMDDRGVPEISAEEEASLTERLTSKREAEFRALLRRSTPQGAALAAPGALGLVLDELAAVRAERDEARERLHQIALAKVWTNEDGKRFVFADDIASAAFGIKPRTEAAR